MKVEKKNFFELFNLPISVDINVESLELNYKKLQKSFHPDNFINSTIVEQTSALRLSSQINDGYNTLKNIVTRIEYILTINGFIVDDSKTFRDKEFLIKQIEINDFIESISSNNNQSNVDIFIKNIGQSMHDTIIEIKKSIDDENYNNAWENLSKLKFYKKSLKQLNTIS